VLCSLFWLMYSFMDASIWATLHASCLHSCWWWEGSLQYSGFCCKCASVKILLYILWKKTLEWNFFVSWVTSFPSLSFCSCVPKHDALFIYFLTQIQLVVFEKFIRQRELCAMIPQERNFLCILSLANILLYFRCRQNSSIQSCQVTVLSWLTHKLCMYMK